MGAGASSWSDFALGKFIFRTFQYCIQCFCDHLCHLDAPDSCHLYTLGQTFRMNPSLYALIVEQSLSGRICRSSEIWPSPCKTSAQEVSPSLSLWAWILARYLWLWSARVSEPLSRMVEDRSLEDCKTCFRHEYVHPTPPNTGFSKHFLLF